MQVRVLSPEIANYSNANLSDDAANQSEMRDRLLAACLGAFELRLDSNALTRIPSCLIESWGSKAGGYALRDLSLDHNQLTLLPAEIGCLLALECLSLHDNSLTVLPDELGCLVNLQQLRLDRNRLCTLPVTISNLKTLSVLHLDGNYFETLPTEIGKCTSLQDLQIGSQNAQLRYLPLSLASCNSLVLIYGDRPDNISSPAWEAGADAVRAELLALSESI